MATTTHIAPVTIELDPAAERDHGRDYSALAERLERGGRDAEQVIAAVHGFEIALPSWAFATGGTRFGRFPGAGEPHTLREKMEDAALVHQLTVGTPRLSLHIPWDETQDLDEILTDARRLGIGFDAVNSNTFQDQPGQPLSYKFGSFSNPSAAVRRQAIEHHPSRRVDEPLEDRDGVVGEAIAAEAGRDHCVVVRPHTAHVVSQRIKGGNARSQCSDSPAAEHVSADEALGAALSQAGCG